MAYWSPVGIKLEGRILRVREFGDKYFFKDFSEVDFKVSLAMQCNRYIC